MSTTTSTTQSTPLTEASVLDRPEPAGSSQGRVHLVQGRLGQLVATGGLRPVVAGQTPTLGESCLVLPCSRPLS